MRHGAFVTTVYDANSNPIASISPLGYITTQAYDTRNRLIGRQDGLGRWHTVTYDNAGRLWMQQDGKGQITTHTYLNCGDEYTSLYADNTRLTFSYNSLRQLTGVADPTGLHTFSYDVLGRLVSFVGPAHPNGQPITYGYDPNSNRTLLQSWQGLQTYTYDPGDLALYRISEQRVSWVLAIGAELGHNRVACQSDLLSRSSVVTQIYPRRSLFESPTNFGTVHVSRSLLAACL